MSVIRSRSVSATRAPASLAACSAVPDRLSQVSRRTLGNECAAVLFSAASDSAACGKFGRTVPEPGLEPTEPAPVLLILDGEEHSN
jgi:hypothetical protein